MGGSSLNKETQTFYSLDTPASSSAGMDLPCHPAEETFFSHYLTCEQDLKIFKILHLRHVTWLQTAPVHAEGLGS